MPTGTIQQGRQGWFGMAFQTDESTPNTTPAVYIPWITDSLQGKHEPIPISHSVASRRGVDNSVQGKKHSEGDLAINMDVTNAGYMFKWFTGNELLATGTPNLHTFYTTVSGNTPKFATVIKNFGDVKQEQFNGVAMDTLTLNFTSADGLIELGSTLMGKFPIDASTQTPTTTSGTILTAFQASLQFGDDVSGAEASSPIAIEEFAFEGSNNLTMIHSTQITQGTNSNDVRTIRLGNLEYGGSYKLFFDNTDERDKYASLLKKVMVVTFQNTANEKVVLRIGRAHVEDQEIATELDDLYGITSTYKGETNRDVVPNDFHLEVSNDKGTVY